MEIRAKVSFQMNPDLVKAAGKRGLEETVLAFGEFVTNEAKKNVMPGIGPGPHPHISEHEDTGALMRAIFNDLEMTDDKLRIIVGCTPPVKGKINYGIVLETGSRFMPPYPWLSPAYHKGRSQFNRFMERGKVAFTAGSWKVSNFAWQKAGIMYPPGGYKKMWPDVPTVSGRG